MTPDAKAFSNIGPVSRVSLARSTLPELASMEATPIPVRRASSGVKSMFAIPRIPEDPNSLAIPRASFRRLRTVAIILFRDPYDSMTMNSKVQGVLFDFGGTLSKQQAPLVIQKILSDEGTPCSTKMLEKALESAWEEDARNATRSEFHGFTRPNEETEYLRLNRLILNHAGIERNGEHLAQLIHEKWAEYASSVTREAFDDVTPCLKKLDQTNLKMGVVSNIDSTRELQKGLSDLRITNYFQTLVASGEVGYAKPHPEIFRIASRELNLPTTSLVHVGDLYAVDVIGAKSAGVTGILIDREDKLPNIDCPRIRSLEELPPLVEEL